MADPHAVVADDHAVTRLGIRRALERVGVSVVAEATNAAGTVAAVRRRRPEVCLIDVELPGGGMAAAREIAAAVPASHVIMMFESGSDEEMLTALRDGAFGCQRKDIDPAALGRAVHAALAGEVPLPRALAARLIEELRCRGGRRTRNAEGASVTLSPRRSEVLDLLRRGLTTKQIAQRLGISAVTVRRHVSEARRRLGAHDRDEALRLTDGPRPKRATR